MYIDIYDATEAIWKQSLSDFDVILTLINSSIRHFLLYARNNVIIKGAAFHGKSIKSINIYDKKKNITWTAVGISIRRIHNNTQTKNLLPNTKKKQKTANVPGHPLITIIIVPLI